MRIVTIIAIVTALAGTARAGKKVEVAVDGGELLPFDQMVRAKLLASQIMRSGAVDLRWTTTPAKPSGSMRRIVIQLEMNTPETTSPGALAYALPYEGTRIVVFFGRIRETRGPDLTATLLAHVMAHEIGHILRGDDHHSASGVMKAHWDSADYLEMKQHPLALAAEDIEAIRMASR